MGSTIPKHIEEAASEWISRQDAGLSPAEEREFQTWRAKDPRHEEALTRYGALWKELDVPRARGHSAAVSHTLARLRRADRLKRVRVVSGTLAVIVATGFGWRTFRPSHEPRPVDFAQIVLTTPSRQILPDGSTVESPPGSQLTVDFTSPSVRRVTLHRGEAHFHVAKDLARPFIVTASEIDVRAIGTAFSVQLGANSVDVLVTEGKVQIERLHSSPKDANESSDRSTPLADTPTYLESGHRVKLELESARVGIAEAPTIETISDTEIRHRLAWRNPWISFSAAPLREVMMSVNRQRSLSDLKPLVIKDLRLGEVLLSGKFNPEDTDAVVEILQSGFGIIIEKTPDGEFHLFQAR